MVGPEPGPWDDPGAGFVPNPMFLYSDSLTELVLDYCRERLALDPVPLDFGGATSESLDQALQGLITAEGRPPGDVLELFATHLATGVISCDSPRFLSFIPAAPTKAALLFDMVVSCSSLQGTSWLEAAGAVAAENQALGVLAQLAGLPPESGGCFVSGGTIANLSALVVARDTSAWWRGRHTGTPLVAVSTESHSSVARSLSIMGAQPLLVQTDDHRLTGPGLRAALDAETDSAGVVAVVATAGTTNAGIVDDLAGVAGVARERGLWFHVDAAYGGAALFAPGARPRFKGIEAADSIVIDPHKWLFAPFDCAGLLYRDPAAAKAVHAQKAAYLEVIHESDGASEAWNPSDYAIHLTRRARGLPLWFSLAVHGTEAYRRAVEAVLDITQRAADVVARAPHLELVRPPELSILLVRRPGWEAEDYAEWSRRLLEEQTAFVTPTTWEGDTVARLAFLHPHTSLAMVEDIVGSMA